MLEATLEVKSEEDKSGKIIRPVLYIQLPSTSWRTPCYSNLLQQDARLGESGEIRHAPVMNLIKLDLVQEKKKIPILHSARNDLTNRNIQEAGSISA